MNLTTIFAWFQSHLLIVVGAIVAGWFFLFSGKKGGRRSTYRNRARAGVRRGYNRRFTKRGRNRARYMR